MSESAIATSVRAADQQDLVRWLARGETSDPEADGGAMNDATLVLRQSRLGRYVSPAAAGWPIYAAVAAYALGASALITATDAERASAFASYIVVWPIAFFGLFPAIYALLVLLRILHRLNPGQGRLRALRRAFAVRHLSQFGTGLGLLGAMMVFQGAFTTIKTALPLWNGGFPYDVLHANIDRALHFGTDPWRYLLAAAGDDVVRAGVEWNYNQGWFIFCYATLFVVCVSYATSGLRTRYLVCYMLVWIIVGNILAGLFLSAGPAFYGHVTGDSARFGEQLAFLAASGDSAHSATKVQTYLWHFYENETGGLGSGISAFPIMHIGLVTLNSLFISEASRRWGTAAFAYVGVVLVSSVYLAWHYAIDGYVAIAVTVAVYYAAKRAFAVRASAAPLPR